MSEQHPWEKAGLGRAPFQFVRLERSTSRTRASCDVCGHAIRRLYWVSEAGGARFKVGSECIKKAEPNGVLAREAEAALREADKVEQRERISVTMEILRSDPALLANVPHWSRGPDGKQRSLREWAGFALANGGTKKQLEVCGIVEEQIAKSRKN